MTLQITASGESNWFVEMITVWLTDPEVLHDERQKRVQSQIQHLELYCTQALELWMQAVAPTRPQSYLLKALALNANQHQAKKVRLLKECCIANVAWQHSDRSRQEMHLAACRLRARAWYRLLSELSPFFDHQSETSEIAHLIK